MEKLVSIEVAKLAAELGFDEDCDHVFESETETRRLNYYEGDGGGFVKNSDINLEYESFTHTAPTQAVLARWLREKKDLHISMNTWIMSNQNGTATIKYVSEILDAKLFNIAKNNLIGDYEVVYEDALLKILVYLKELLQKEAQKERTKEKY